MKYQAIDGDYIREMKEYDEFMRDKKLMYKGLKYGYFLAILIIILSALFNGNLVLATPNDIEYTFQNDNLYETTAPFYSDSFNIRNQTSIIPANLSDTTYSFTEDVIGGNPTDWTINEGGGSVNVIDSFRSHENVLELNDTSGAGRVDATQSFSVESDAIFEFWWAVNEIAQTWNIVMSVYEGGTSVMAIAINDDDLESYDVAWVDIKTDFIGIDTFFHLKFVLNDSDNSFDCYVNNVLEADDFNFQNPNTNGITAIEFKTSTDDILISRIDALGYLWDNGYSLGDNIFPTSTELNITEVNKWEFAYSDFPTQYAVGSDVFSDWTEIDTGDYVNIAKDYTSLDGMPLYFPDRKIKIHDHTGSGADIGIERDFNILDGIINISWSINFTVHPGVVYNGETTIEIYSNDDTLISRIYSEMKRLCYKDSGGNEVILDSDVMHEGENYDFNFYNDPDDDITLLRFDIDGVNWDTYLIPNLDSSKRGLGKIKFINYHESSEELILYLDNIGVYSNGTSLSTEPAFRQIDLDDGLFHSWWDFPEANLLTLNLKGNIGIHLTDWYFYISPEANEIEEVLSAREFNGTDIIYNLYDHTFNSENYVYSPRFWFEFYDQIELETDDYLISMDGVVLDDGVTNYHLEFTSQNVETYNSYFYVSGDSLYFMMEANENGLEYIQASFDILNVFSGNRSLLYRGKKSGTSVINSQFLTYYSDTTYNYFNLEANYKDIAVLLPRDKTIDTFDLLITDDGSDLSDSITGFLGSFTLLYVPLIATDFVSISFFDVLPIVVLVVIIPIALYVGFGRKKELLVPSIMGMSIFGTAVGLIPLWLTFVIGFGCVSYYLIDRRN